MGLWGRISQVVRSQITQINEQRLDPEAQLHQVVREMEYDLLQLRQAVAQAIALYKRTERLYATHESQASHWYRQAQTAMDQGQEDRARHALAKRQPLLAALPVLDEQLRQQGAIAEQMKQNLRLLEAKLIEARTQRDLYVMRARSAEASQRLNEALHRYNPQGAIAAFERMEDNVLQLESQAELAAERALDAVDRQFTILEQQAAVEAEMQRLRDHSSSRYPSQR